jgi:hypothetical protein
MSDQQPATKQDVQESETRLTTTIREVETNLLRAFHGYAERVDLRLRRLETAEAFSAERVAALEAGGLWADLQRRIIELERRLPPSTAQH